MGAQAAESRWCVSIRTDTMVGMDVVVQWVETSWSKKSRGGPWAARRNAAPVGLPLPPAPYPAVHEVLIDETEDFVPRVPAPSDPASRHRPDSTGRHTQVGFDEVGDRLRVTVNLQSSAVPRVWRPPAVWLDRGQWLRWQVNYRFAFGGRGGGEWAYRLDTLNLAYGLPERRVFTGTPSTYVDERGDLW